MATRSEKIRHLDIDDVERARRYRGFYGGCVSDALHGLGRVPCANDRRGGINGNRGAAAESLALGGHSARPYTGPDGLRPPRPTQGWDDELISLETLLRGPER